MSRRLLVLFASFFLFPSRALAQPASSPPSAAESPSAPISPPSAAESPVVPPSAAESPSPSAAESPSPSAAERHPDYLLPGGGKLSMSFATGIPFLAMTEVAVGIGDRFAIGGLAGIAMSGDGPPTNVGFGLRPRVDAWHNANWRVEAVVPILYYPKTNGTWFLTRPSVQVERTWNSGWRAYGGAGVVAVMAEGAPAALPYGGTPGQKAGDATNGIWNTFTIGGAMPIGKKTSVFGEGVVVLDGYKLPGQEWVGGVPFVLTFGISTTL